MERLLKDFNLQKPLDYIYWNGQLIKSIDPYLNKKVKDLKYEYNEATGVVVNITGEDVFVNTVLENKEELYENIRDYLEDEGWSISKESAVKFSARYYNDSYSKYFPEVKVFKGLDSDEAIMIDPSVLQYISEDSYTEEESLYLEDLKRIQECAELAIDMSRALKIKFPSIVLGKF